MSDPRLSMTDPRSTIPFDRLPAGFAQTLEHPPETPAPAHASATIVLMREGHAALEVLLLRRVRTAGFVPGAFVFPGGRVDADDALAPLVDRLDGLTATRAAERLGLASDADPPAVAYYVAALREAFEETGLLVGRDRAGAPAPCAHEDATMRALLRKLRDDEVRLPSVLDRLGCRLDGGAVAYIGHWITPVVEPRRFDTRFFAAAVPAGQEAVIHEAELSEAVWLTPAEALELNVRGGLPMVFPTIRTLESLLPYRAPAEVLEGFANREIPTILPKLVSTPRGVGMELPRTK
jgi:8-oxo-dGTP pyrophosphatase MutT (NUDIX family)